jgi:hypothetical protein
LSRSSAKYRCKVRRKILFFSSSPFSSLFRLFEHLPPELSPYSTTQAEEGSCNDTKKNVAGDCKGVIKFWCVKIEYIQQKGADMATAKKTLCVGTVKEDNKCKKVAVGKSASQVHSRT